MPEERHNRKGLKRELAAAVALALPRMSDPGRLIATEHERPTEVRVRVEGRGPNAAPARYFIIKVIETWSAPDGEE